MKIVPPIDQLFYLHHLYSDNYSNEKWEIAQILFQINLLIGNYFVYTIILFIRRMGNRLNNIPDTHR